MNKLLSPIFLAMILLSGCASRTLDPAGVYAGDKFLYEADSTIKHAYDDMWAFVKWEQEFRQPLSRWPEINKTANIVRANGKDWIQSAINAREAYVLSKGDQSKSQLNIVLTLIRMTLADVSSYYLQTTNTTAASKIPKIKTSNL